MANAFIKIGTALLKHQVKKLVGDEALEVLSEELAEIGEDKLDSWLGDKSKQSKKPRELHAICSAAILTGLLGANALLGEPFNREQILKLAIENEGHPDNVAPAMLGGLVASIIHDDRVVSLRLTLTGQRTPIHITVVLPEFDFPTKQARAILPKVLDRKDAIYNISRAVFVTEAFRVGDREMLGEAMTDRLHQPTIAFR